MQIHKRARTHTRTPILLLNDPRATAEQRDDFSAIKSPNNSHSHSRTYYYYFIFMCVRTERGIYYGKKSAQALNYAIFHIGRK